MMMDVQNLLSKTNKELFDELLEAIRIFSVSHEFDDDVCIVGMEFAPKSAAEF
jgi:serine phosphatase RsbU (regulator of sigma subunit)